MQENTPIKCIHVSAAIIFRESTVFSTLRQAQDGAGSTTGSRREVFATARGYGDYKGWWEFPGGKIEHDENGNEIEKAEECLIREICEELDSTINIEEKIATVEWDYPATAHSAAFHLTMECFACSLVSGKLTLLEAEDSRWLAADSLESVNWLPADALLLPKIRARL